MAWFTLVFPPWLRPPRLLESRGAGEVAVGHRRVQAKSSKSQCRRITGSRPRCTPLRRWPSNGYGWIFHRKLGRDLPDGTRKRLQVYLGGGGIFRPKPPVFDRSWRSPSKNTVKNSTEDTCSWTRPSKIGKRKVKKTCVFQLLTSIFWFATSFFAVPQVAGPGGGFLSFWTRFRTDFRRFVIAETLVFTVFFCFLHAWRLASKLPKTS